MIRRLFLACCAAPLAAASSSPAAAVDFESIVDCRVAVERALHERRDWPAQNPGRKPTFESLVTRADVARRVRAAFADAERARAAGARFDRTVLQAELERMSNATRDPALLAKLFAAAGDGERAALCLALPDLAARASADATGTTTGASPSRFDVGGIVLPRIGAKGTVGPDTRQEPPEPRYGHTAVWTGAEMVVFGGSNTNVRWRNGSRYVPATDGWVPLSRVAAPTPRFLGVAVWTGLDVIVFGGTASQAESDTVGDHGRYRPANDSWSALPTANAPSGRFHATAVWTGTSMLVFGGANGSGVLSDGGAYMPSTNSWAPLPAAPAGSQRHRAAAAWTGTEMLIYGGAGSLSGDFLATGLRYTPGNPGTWATMSGTGAPSARTFATAVWFGAPVSRLVVWGGNDGAGSLGDGALYDPLANAWAPMSTAGAPAPRTLHTAISTGSEMIVWGGAPGGTASLGDGARYSPAANAWTGAVQPAGAPAARRQHTAVWTGDAMIVWGGIQPPTPTHSGGRYDPAGNAWSATWSPRACSAITGNLVPNCGFEDGSPPTGWQGGGLAIASDAILYRGGAKAGRQNSFSGAIGPESLLISPCFPITGSQRYELGAHVRASQIGSMACRARLRTHTSPDCTAGLQIPAGGADVAVDFPAAWVLARGVTAPTSGTAVAAQLQLTCLSVGGLSYVGHFDDAFVFPAADALFADSFE